MKDLFAVFDFERRFNIDSKSIEKKYFQLSRETHPDFHLNKNEFDKSGILAKSSLINQAYVCLKEPFLRAKHILELEWPDIPDSELKKISQSFLFEVMDIQDTISDYHDSNKNEKINKMEKLKQLESNLKIRSNELLNNLYELDNEWILILNENLNSKIPFMKRINELINTKIYIRNLLQTIYQEINNELI